MTPCVSDIPRVRPRWLRPGAIVVTIGLHLSALFVLTVPRPALPSVGDMMEITIAQGEPVVEQPPAPPAPPAPETPPQPPPSDPPPVQPPPQEQPPPDPTPQEQPPDPTPPEPTPPVETEAPKREVADAPAIPLHKPQPKPKPRPKVVKPAPETEQKQETQQTPPSEAKQTGEQDAHDQAMRAEATYAGKVLAAIRSHRPDDVSGSGSVAVSFVVNVAGEMTNVTILRSSGKHALDAIALRMVRAARPGPPPDGNFARSMTINFVGN